MVNSIIMNRKILLLHAPFKKYAFGKDWELTESIGPPIGLLYLASPLIQEGYKLSFIDLNVDNLEKREFLNLLKEQNFILISCYTGTIKNVKKIIKDIKKVNTDAFILCGGPHINVNEEYINGSYLTCIGEAESYIVQIINSIVQRKSLKGIPGLLYKKNGKIIRHPGFMEAIDLDSSIPPSRELFENKDYGYLGGFKIKLTPIVSSRGCPFNCNFCTHKGRSPYRERSIDNFMEELKVIVKRGYKYVFFCDDIFLLNKKRVNKIMDRLIKEKINIKMVMNGRVDSCDIKFYKKLKKSGVGMIMFGIESINQDVLNFYNKKIKYQKIKETINLVNKAGIITFGYFIIGAPIETKEYFNRTKKFFDDVPLDIILINILCYSKGSKLWEDAYKKGLIKKDEYVVQANKNLSKYSTKELIVIKNDLIKHFFSNKRRLFRIFYKIIRLGLLPLFLKSFLQGKISNFFDSIQNPKSTNAYHSRINKSN